MIDDFKIKKNQEKFASSIQKNIDELKQVFFKIDKELNEFKKINKNYFEEFSEKLSNLEKIITFDENKVNKFWKIENEFKDTFNLTHYLRLKACLDTCEYIEKNASMCEVFSEPFKLLEKGVSMAQYYESQNLSDGLFLEFGVCSGKTINKIAEFASKKKIYGFDSFEGLPEDWRSNFPKGMFKVERIPNVRKNIELKIGLFKNTLPEFIANSKSKMISFLHIDCDLYSSTKDVLFNCRPLIKKGTIICFDEYWNYPGWLNNEFKAWSEFCKSNNISYRYVGYVDNFQQVLVEVI